VSQEQFEARHAALWAEVERLLDLHEGRALSAQEQRALGRLSPMRAEGSQGLEQLPALYRRLCQHLALARHRGHSAPLQDRLNALALRGQVALYRRPGAGLRAAAHRLLVEVPQAVRAEAGLVLLAHALLYLPAAGVALAVWAEPAVVYEVLDPLQLASFEAMYDPGSDQFLRERAADDDTAMFGFYIRNNIGVAYNCLGAGVLGGLGSAYMLATNGLLLGAVGAHLAHVGSWTPFSSFVIGHGAWELTAIVLAGAAGLRLGLTLLAPRGRSRGAALRSEARGLLTLTYGFSVMLLIAAWFEAYWSSSASVDPTVKYGVGAGLWVLVYGWLLLVGRGEVPRGA
jgi:uncharacterized membrane protein SpoIIM required for sporulation